MSFYGIDMKLPVWQGYYWWFTLSKLATLLKQHSMSVLSYLDWYFLACKLLSNSYEKTWSMHILHDSLNWWNCLLFYLHISIFASVTASLLLSVALSTKINIALCSNLSCCAKTTQNTVMPSWTMLKCVVWYAICALRCCELVQSERKAVNKNFAKLEWIWLHVPARHSVLSALCIYYHWLHFLVKCFTSNGFCWIVDFFVLAVHRPVVPNLRCFRGLFWIGRGDWGSHPMREGGRGVFAFYIKKL